MDFRERPKKDFLEGIKVDNITYARVKKAAGLAYFEPFGSLIDYHSVHVSGDLRRAEMLANLVQRPHRPGNTSADDTFGKLVHEALVGLDRSNISDSLQWRALVRHVLIGTHTYLADLTASLASC